jgi:hypothetical protein
LIRRHQGTFGHRRAANAAGNRREQPCINQIDLRGLGRRFALRRGGDRIVEVLTAYGLCGLEWPIALDQGRRRTRHRRGAIQSRAIQRGIDLIELLSRLDVAALDEHSLLHDAADLRTNFRRAVSDCAAR